MNSKDNGSEQKSIRLQVYLARGGVASRRKSEQYILAGRVKVNGKVVRELGTKVNPSDSVSFDDYAVEPITKKLYIALHKPPGYLCSNSDPFGRPLAVDFLKNDFNTRLFNVGRLDFQSSGLIFFTNDGEFGKIVTHPSYEIEKEYFVETKKQFDETVLRKFVHGIWIDGVHYAITNYRFVNETSAYISLYEGKNRELRRLFKFLGIAVKTIHRIRIGRIGLDNLPPGKYRHLSEEEIATIFKKGRGGDC